jgi:hypothetical protein
MITRAHGMRRDKPVAKDGATFVQCWLLKDGRCKDCSALIFVTPARGVHHWRFETTDHHTPHTRPPPPYLTFRRYLFAMPVRSTVIPRSSK